MSFFDVSSRHEKSPHRSVQQNRCGDFPSYFFHLTSYIFLHPSDLILNFIDACSILQSAFGKAKLDVVTKKGLSPYIGETILKEVEYV